MISTVILLKDRWVVGRVVNSCKRVRINRYGIEYILKRDLIIFGVLSITY